MHWVMWRDLQVAECGDAKANATPRRTGLSSKLKLAFDHVHEHIDTMRNKDTKGASLNFKHLSDKMQRNLHGAALKNKMLR